MWHTLYDFTNKDTIGHKSDQFSSSIDASTRYAYSDNRNKKGEKELE